MRPADGLAARKTAHAILVRVYRDGAWAERLLATGLEHLGEVDRGFVTHLVYGTLRQTIYLDFLLAQWLKRPPNKLPLATLAALRLGAFQLLDRRAATHAAVDTTVAIVGLRHPHLKAVSNAVLRRIAEAIAASTLPQPQAKLPDPVAALAVAAAHPEWLTRRVAGLLGVEEAQAWTLANNAPAALCLRVHHLRGSTEALLARLRATGINAQPTWLPSAILLPGGGSVRDLPGFAEGAFVVQDLGAQAVGLLPQIVPGMRVLDACSAPGGKTLHVADRLMDRGEVIAVDKHASKTRLIADSTARLGLASVRVAVCNASDSAALAKVVGEPVDLALIDAPCSGSGTLQRHPELRLKDASNLPGLITLQRLLLDSVATQVRPGAHLVYSVCSILPEEGMEQVRGFLDRHADFTLVTPAEPSLQPVVTTLPGLGPILQTWPHRHGCDGFFAALLRRAP